jgi:urea transporter
LKNVSSSCDLNCVFSESGGDVFLSLDVDFARCRRGICFMNALLTIVELCCNFCVWKERMLCFCLCGVVWCVVWHYVGGACLRLLLSFFRS